MNTTYRLLAFVASVGLTACSTPQVAMDQANHGAGLIAQLELELKEFRRVEAASETARLDSLANQMDALEEMRRSTAPDVRARKSAGDSNTTQLIEKMLADADGIASDDATSKATLKASDTTLSKLLSPLPSTTAATTATQSKLAEMGVALSASTRYAELLAFGKAIKENVDANKKKIKDAESAAK